ncbi:TIGR02530 family flagellar biosynthesis protein [Caloranaerobacter ferrireducens]|uniref:TIGR02530 family flagellar biosynthesis protein n=1 Tax=Caloranaerobacter ferrireducens TaxID=1323370 RepID=UPI00084D60D1|nr:TIGR02530 family flagellar biosynthesis protein [Caloranaerobacter ferrireducens]
MSVSYENIIIKNRINSNGYIKKEINVKQNCSFDDILRRLEKKSSQLKFSKHAIERMELRNIKLNKEDLKNIENAVSKAESKGVKEALILFKNTAFIISIKNRTVITTVTHEQLKENVFTNIDGAVII